MTPDGMLQVLAIALLMFLILISFYPAVESLVVWIQRKFKKPSKSFIDQQLEELGKRWDRKR